MPFFGNRKIIHLKIRNKREKFYYKGGKRTFGNNQEQALTAKVTLKNIYRRFALHKKPQKPS